METIEKLKKVRLEKLKSLIKIGINPYSSTAEKKDIIANCLKLHGQNVLTAGRIIAIRGHGGSSFIDLQDQSGKIQLFVAKDKISDGSAKILEFLDIGDFIQIEGNVGKTQAGQITIFVSNLKLLTKSLRPIPQTFYGLKDVETRLRKRYVDLIVNREVLNLFERKAKFWASIRNYLLDKDFTEVESPALEPIPGGADATPFVTHHNALNTDYYLRISLELYQKRLLVGGFDKVFEIGKIFRNEGIDAEHLQDYLQMEFYWAYADYKNLAEMIPDMYRKIIKETLGTTIIMHNNKKIDWQKRWETIDYSDSFKQETSLDLTKNPNVNDLLKLAQKVGANINKKMGKGRLIDSIYKKVIRPKIENPTLLVNHPVEVSPLAKRNEDNPSTVQRLQVLAAGTEIGNGWSELNDPIDQKERFEQQQELRKAGDEEAQMYDSDFIEALEYGMPPAVGFGLSQRLFAVLVNKPIRETVFFPQVRPKNK